MADETIEDFPDGAISTALAKENLTEKIIAELRAKAEELTIAGMEDRAGYEAVRKQRLATVPYRTLAVKIAKEGRAEAIAIQQRWIGVEKMITGKISAIEKILQDKEDEYLEAHAKIERERQRVEDERVDGLMLQLSKYGVEFSRVSVAQLGQDEFAELLQSAKERRERIEAEEAERKRLAEIAEAERQAEAERVRLEGLELARQRAEIEAERQKFEAEKAELKRMQEQNARDIEAVNLQIAAAQSALVSQAVDRAIEAAKPIAAGIRAVVDFQAEDDLQGGLGFHQSSEESSEERDEKVNSEESEVRAWIDQIEVLVSSYPTGLGGWTLKASLFADRLSHEIDDAKDALELT